MARYFVITRAEDVNEVKMWNKWRTADLPLLCIADENERWITWEVTGDEMTSLFLEPWVKSIRMKPNSD